MRSITSAVLLAVATVALALLQSPADAAPRKRTAAAYQPSRYIYYDRAPTRLTVRKRSFLDPGTESKTFAQHYTDYAVSPSYTIFPKYFDYSAAPGSWSRMPLPGLYDIPGWFQR
jgi:hypothetical protein